MPGAHPRPCRRLKRPCCIRTDDYHGSRKESTPRHVRVATYTFRNCPKHEFPRAHLRLSRKCFPAPTTFISDTKKSAQPIRSAEHSECGFQTKSFDIDPGARAKSWRGMVKSVEFDGIDVFWAFVFPRLRRAGGGLLGLPFAYPRLSTHKSARACLFPRKFLER